MSRSRKEVRPDPVEAMSAKAAFDENAPLPESALRTLDWINRKDAYADELLAAGNEMAAAIEDRWSGPNGCDCEVCTTAKAWRELTAE